MNKNSIIRLYNRNELSATLARPLLGNDNRLIYKIYLFLSCSQSLTEKTGTEVCAPVIIRTMMVMMEIVI